MVGFCCCDDSPTNDCVCCQPGSAPEQVTVTIPAAWLVLPGSDCDGALSSCALMAGTFLLDRAPHPTVAGQCYWERNFSWTPAQCKRGICCAQKLSAAIECVYNSFTLVYDATVVVRCKWSSGSEVWANAYAGSINCRFAGLSVAHSGFVTPPGCANFSPVELSAV